MQMQHYAYVVVLVQDNKQNDVSNCLPRSGNDKTKDKTCFDKYQKATRSDTPYKHLNNMSYLNDSNKNRLFMLWPHHTDSLDLRLVNIVSCYFMGMLLQSLTYERQSHVISQLHASHKDLTQTQQSARTAVFWFETNHRIRKNDQCLVTLAKQCTNAPSIEQLTLSEIPDCPRQTLGSDHFQSLCNLAIVREFKMQIIDFECPAIVRSDNGSLYSAKEFRGLCRALTKITKVRCSKDEQDGQHAIQNLTLMLYFCTHSVLYWLQLNCVSNTILSKATIPLTVVFRQLSLHFVVRFGHFLAPLAYS